MTVVKSLMNERLCCYDQRASQITGGRSSRISCTIINYILTTVSFNAQVNSDL